MVCNYDEKDSHYDDLLRKDVSKSPMIGLIYHCLLLILTASAYLILLAVHQNERLLQQRAEDSRTFPTLIQT